MAAPDTVIKLNSKTQEALVSHINTVVSDHFSGANMREYLETIDKEVMRENYRTSAQATGNALNAMGDKSKLKDPIVPVIQPKLATAHSFMVATFLQGFPIFAMVGSPQKQLAAVQMNTLMERDQQQFKWQRNLSMALMDGLKYNFMALEVDWCEEKVYSVENDGNSGLRKKTETLRRGNRINRIDPYNVIYDMTVPLAEVHETGDYAGYLKVYTKTQLKSLISTLVNNPLQANCTSALQEPPSTTKYKVPQINSNLSFPREKDWMSWATGMPAQGSLDYYRKCYEVLTLYARIIPSDFGINSVSSPNTPQVWKFLIVNGKYIIWAERLSNAHNYLPILLGQPLEEGLGMQTKSFAENLIPFQDIATALSSARFASLRRSISDRAIYNPAIIDASQINNPNPNAKIPTKPTAGAQSLANAYYSIPYNDSTASGLNAELGNILAMADQVSGVNAAQQGQFVKGNKTMQEFDTIMTNANSRLQTLALMIENQVLIPLKSILRSNILQYQPPQSLYSSEQRGNVSINPAELVDAEMDFAVADGLLPIDKLVSNSTLELAVNAVSTVPALAETHKVGDMLGYLFQTRGLKYWNDFKYTPEEQAQRQAQMQAQAQAQAQAQ